MSFEAFKVKPGYKALEHGGYLITYNTYPGEKIICIFEELEPGKFKMRRQILGPQRGHDDFGNKVFEIITDLEKGLNKAKNFIDNHIKPFRSK